MYANVTRIRYHPMPYRSFVLMAQSAHTMQANIRFLVLSKYSNPPSFPRRKFHRVPPPISTLFLLYSLYIPDCSWSVWHRARTWISVRAGAYAVSVYVHVYWPNLELLLTVSEISLLSLSLPLSLSTIPCARKEQKNTRNSLGRNSNLWDSPEVTRGVLYMVFALSIRVGGFFFFSNNQI